MHPLRCSGIVQSGASIAWANLCSQLGLVSSAPIDIHWGPDATVGDTGQPVLHRDLSFTPDSDTLAEGVAYCCSVLDKPADALPTGFECDLIAWSQWFYQRHSEAGAGLDNHGRVQRSSSVQDSAGFPHLPVIDLMFDAFREYLQAFCAARGISLAAVPRWPRGKTFAVMLSHDIDNAVERSGVEASRKAAAALLALTKGDPKLAQRRLREALGLAGVRRHNPYWLMEPMAELEASHGFRATYFVLPHTRRRVLEGRTVARRYDVLSAPVRRMLSALVERGAELGLHSTYNSHDVPGGIASDLTLLLRAVPNNVDVRGARSHYLRFDETTYQEERSAGIAWDSTLGWAHGWGFRSGTTYPYLVDVGNEAVISQLGLHVMDVAVGADAWLQASVQLLDVVSSGCGVASILVHPNPSDTSATQHLLTYAELLQTIGSDFPSGWVATGSEIHRATVAHLQKVVAPEILATLPPVSV